MRKDEDVKGNSLRKYGEGDEAFGRRAGQKGRSEGGSWIWESRRVWTYSCGR